MLLYPCRPWLYFRAPRMTCETRDNLAGKRLAVSNSQGELSPLDIGIHALRAVPPEKGGRGKKGGLSAYAEAIGKAKQHVSTYREAAEVFLAVKPSHQCDGFHDKTQHLADTIGRSKQFVSQLRQAAEVAVTCQVNLTGLHDKTQHLAAIWPAGKSAGL